MCEACTIGFFAGLGRNLSVRVDLYHPAVLDAFQQTVASIALPEMASALMTVQRTRRWAFVVKRCPNRGERNRTDTLHDLPLPGADAHRRFGHIQQVSVHSADLWLL